MGFRPYRCVLLTPVFVLLSTHATPSFAQSGAEYEAWLAWCESIGIPNYDPNNPVCTPNSDTGGGVYQSVPAEEIPPTPEEELRALLDSAHRLIAMGKTDRARDEVNLALQLFPDDAEALALKLQLDPPPPPVPQPVVTTAPEVPVLPAAGSAITGSEQAGGCQPSQDASVVDLCFDRKSAPVAAFERSTDPVALPIIDGMLALARQQNWSAEKLARLDYSLNTIGTDADASATPDDYREVWQDIRSRAADPELAQKAGTGEGPGLYSAGTQSFEDCTIFALANAAGLPYSVVAARATDLISQAVWRPQTDRNNPQGTIEGGGLNGYEVLMMAEMFGQAEVIDRTDFAKTVREGRPVMINVIPVNATGGHQIVLSKTFQHEGETWFEIINSGTAVRQYLSASELDVILQEDGIAYRPETGTTPQLLRTP